MAEQTDIHSVINALAQKGQWGGDYEQRLRGFDTQFRTEFERLVGRNPGADEAAKMYETVFMPNLGAFNDPNSYQYQRFGDQVRSEVSNLFQPQVEQNVSTQLQQQQGEANRLADLFRTQGNEAINGVEQSLLGYQQKLFERLRPNLITSLQAQGLLNTGGLNQALAGQQADLANEAGQQVADLRFQNEQGANEIAFSGAAAPYEFQRGQTLSRLPQAQAFAEGAMNRLFSQQSADQAFRNQLELMNRQQQIQREGRKSLSRIFGESLMTNLGQHVGGNSYSGGSYNYNAGGEGGSGGGSSASGGGSSGAGSMAGKYWSFSSSKHVKKNIAALSEKEEEELYDRLVKMPLYKWHYKTEDDKQARHLGTLTQEAIPEIVAEDGEHLSPIDYFGVLTLALKVQHRRMQKVA